MSIEMSVEPSALSREVMEVEGFFEYSLDHYQTAVCLPEVSNFGSDRH